MLVDTKIKYDTAHGFVSHIDYKRATLWIKLSRSSKGLKAKFNKQRGVVIVEGFPDFGSNGTRPHRNIRIGDQVFVMLEKAGKMILRIVCVTLTQEWQNVKRHAKAQRRQESRQRRRQPEPVRPRFPVSTPVQVYA